MKENDQEEPIKEPKNFQWLVDNIGLGSTLRLIESFGGDRLYINKTVSLSRRWVRVVGKAAAEILVETYPGESFYVPTGAAEKMRIRNEVIIKEYDRGGKILNIAKAHGISGRRVYSIIGGEEKKPVPNCKTCKYRYGAVPREI